VCACLYIFVGDIKLTAIYMTVNVCREVA